MKSGTSHWFRQSLRGACMGAADTVPGISGGTVALILGIYEKFIAAVSAIGPAFVVALFKGEFWRRVGRGFRDPSATGDDAVGVFAHHFLFLVFLLLGVVAAVLVGARFIPELLTRYPEPMKGFFLGLVLASVAIPYKLIRTRTSAHLGVILLFAVGTFFFVAIPVDQSQRATGVVQLEFPSPLTEELTLTPWQEKSRFTTDRYKGERPKAELAFLPVGAQVVPVGAMRAEVPVRSVLAGKVANLAPHELVVLTGVPDGTRLIQPLPMEGGEDPAIWFVFVAGVLAISAMVLPGISGSFVLLMLGLYHYIFFNVRMLVYERDAAALNVVLVFIVALVIGVATFSRFLRWLFKRHHDLTLAALVGIMAGSLRELWPFKQVNAAGQAENALPADLDGTFVVTLVFVLAGLVLVIAVERVGNARAARA